MYGFHVNEYNKETKNLFLKYNCGLYQTFIDEYKKTLNFQPELKPVIHGSFYINIASDNQYNYYMLKREIKYCLKHNIKYYVLHVGKCGKKLKLSDSQCINNMFNLLKRICKHYKLYNNDNFYLCLEMLSGDKGDIIYTFKELNDLIYKNKHYYFKNLKICLDLCHVYVSGVDISTSEGFDNYIKEFDDLIGLDKIGLIHFNNSYNDFNSKIDRHADIKDGKISVETMIYMFKYFNDNKFDLIFEMKNFKEDLEALFK